MKSIYLAPLLLFIICINCGKREDEGDRIRPQENTSNELPESRASTEEKAEDTKKPKSEQDSSKVDIEPEDLPEPSSETESLSIIQVDLVCDGQFDVSFDGGNGGRIVVPSPCSAITLECVTTQSLVPERVKDNYDPNEFSLKASSNNSSAGIGGYSKGQCENLKKLVETELDRELASE